MIKSIEIVANVTLENGELKKLTTIHDLDYYKDRPKAQASSLDGLVDSIRKSLFILWAEQFKPEEAQKHIEVLDGYHKLLEAYLKNVADGKTEYIYEKNRVAL